MDAKKRYDKITKKIFIKCSCCERIFIPAEWDKRTRQGFNDPNNPEIDIKPILETFDLDHKYWAWYTCPGCNTEVNSNALRIINYNEDINNIEP